MTTNTVKTDEFYVKSEDGRRFLILEFTEYKSVRTFDGESTPSPIGKDLRTSEGMNVGFLGDESYEILDLGLRVRRIRDL